MTCVSASTTRYSSTSLGRIKPPRAVVAYGSALGEPHANCQLCVKTDSWLSVLTQSWPEPAVSAIGEERESAPDVGHHGGVDVGDQDRFTSVTGGEHLADRIDDPAVAAVAQPVALPHPVHADHVGLVLDCARGEQAHPVVPAGFRPVRHHHVCID